MLGLSFAYSTDRQPSADTKDMTFIEEKRFYTCTVLEDNHFDTFTVSPWNTHPFIFPLSNSREIKLGVGVGKGCAPQQTLFLDINSYCCDYNPVFRSNEFMVNHCKSVSNYWLQEIAKDGSGGLLHRCAENDFIQFSHPYTEIEGSEKLRFLTNLAKFADQQTLQDALQVTDSEGNTPLMLARKTGHNKVADLYEQWMDESSTSELETSNTETDLNADVSINLID